MDKIKDSVPRACLVMVSNLQSSFSRSIYKYISIGKQFEFVFGVFSGHLLGLQPGEGNKMAEDYVMVRVHALTFTNYRNRRKLCFGL